jgi:hypothetical protein
VVSAPWNPLVHEPSRDRHVVQLYRDEGVLRRAVVAWIAPSLRAGGGAALLCTHAHATELRRELREAGLGPEVLERAGRLVFVDAREAMARFLVGDAVDAAAFKALGAEIFGKIRQASTPGREIRAWGEIVDVLWKEERPETAMLLEALWNDVIVEQQIRLLCSYEVDNLDPESHAGTIRDMCGSHSLLVPEEDPERFDAALSLALVRTFGQDEARSLRQQYGQRRTLPLGMPPAQAVILAMVEADAALARRVLLATRQELQRMRK